MRSSVSEPVLFSVLPKWKTPWSELFFSYGIQAIAVGIFIWIPVLHPEILESPQRDYHFVNLVPTPVPENHAPQKRLPTPVIVARLDPAPALKLPSPQPRPKLNVEVAPAPEVKIAAKKQDILPPSAAPAIPKKIIATNLFSTGSSAPQTIDRAAQKVQTGGFGDPNGVPARPTQTQAVNISRAGGFDMPLGPGYGNGTGGSKGERGVVASAGFGSGVAIADTRNASGIVRQAGFGDADAPVAKTISHAAAPVEPKMVPAEILSKPTPLYTEEARAKKIEGEVLLEVVFEANGKIHVVRVVRGLGHGLDDSAVRAAEQIRFRPALKDGQPSDSTAFVHIIFQLA